MNIDEQIAIERNAAKMVQAEILKLQTQHRMRAEQSAATKLSCVDHVLSAHCSGRSSSAVGVFGAQTVMLFGLHCG